MSEAKRDKIIIVFLALLIAGITWQLSVIIPQAITYEGVEVGDIGVAYVSLVNWLNGGSAYNIQATSGNTILNITAYPFTTSLVVTPLLFLPLKWIAPFFSALSAGLLAYGILRKREMWRLLVFLSFPYIATVFATQMSPLFAAALYLPFLLPIAVAKPQLGLSLLAIGRWTKATVFIAFSLIILSILLYPHWISDYLSAGNFATYIGWIPITISCGFFLIIAIFRWRTTQGRLLLSLSIVPQRIFYDQFLILFVPRNAYEQIILVICSWILIVVGRLSGWILNFSENTYRAELLVLIFLYMPALIMVMIHKEQQEPDPIVTWIDRLIAFVKIRLMKKNNIKNP